MTRLDAGWQHRCRARRRAWLLTGLLATAAAVTGLDPRAAVAAQSLTIALPTRVVAGSSVPVQIGGSGDDAVSLVVLTGIGVAELRARSVGGQATFTVGSDLTQTAGITTVYAESGGRTAMARFRIDPGPVVSPVIAIVGARSIVADSADTAMAVAQPLDAWGNSIAEGTTVHVLRRRPDQSVEDRPRPMQNLLVWAEMRSGIRAGRGHVWMAVGDVTGRPSDLDEVAAPPLPFTLAPVDPVLARSTRADAQSLVQIRTDVLTDPNGNVQPDGTMVAFQWTGPQGRGTASALTVAGVARLGLEAPDEPGSITISAMSRGTASRPLRLEFEPAVGEIPVTAVRSGTDVEVRIGPIRRLDGPHVPDGTRLSVVATDERGQSATADSQIIGGEATVLVPVGELTGPLTVRVGVLGVSGEAQVR